MLINWVFLLIEIYIFYDFLDLDKQTHKNFGAQTYWKETKFTYFSCWLQHPRWCFCFCICSCWYWCDAGFLTSRGRIQFSEMFFVKYETMPYYEITCFKSKTVTFVNICFLHMKPAFLWTLNVLIALETSREWNILLWQTYSYII